MLKGRFPPTVLTALAIAIMRRFYLEWQISQTLSAESNLSTLAQKFPLPWSHYVRLLSVQDLKAREFYETEALRAGWSERQLKRQIEEARKSIEEKILVVSRVLKPKFRVLKLDNRGWKAIAFPSAQTCQQLTTLPE
ncbi:MAG: DUF1016 N-terminal domain-containing protein [Nostoc sp.]